MDRPTLSPQQQAEAQRIYDALRQVADADLHDLAQLLASKDDGDILDATEFAVREAVHRIGAKALETALQGRKKGGTTAPAVPGTHCRRAARFQRPHGGSRPAARGRMERTGRLGVSPGEGLHTP